MVVSVLLARLSSARNLDEVNLAADEARRELELIGREIEALGRANCGPIR